MNVDIHGRKCYCESYGRVQAYSSLRAMTNDVIKAMNEFVLTDRVSNIENV